MGSKSRRPSFVLAAGLILALSLCGVRAQVPTNDNFPGIDLSNTFPTGDTGNNFSATLEVDEPNPLLGDRSVWWTWQSPITGQVEINTDGSDFDTILYVFTGSSLNLLVPLRTNDEGLSPPQSTVVFTATAGQVYRIAVLGFDADSEGDITLNIIAGPPPPENDNFIPSTTPVTDPYVLSGAPIVDAVPGPSGTNLGASIQMGEPDPSADGGLTEGGASVWWRWSPTVTGYYQIDTLSSDFDTLLYVFTGPIIPLQTLVVGNDDDTADVSQSRVVFLATAGTNYNIAVHGLQGETGDVVLNIASAATPPTNDNFGSPEVLTSASPTTAPPTTNAGASLELLEPDSFLLGGTSIWYSWTAPSAGRYQVNTFGSDFDTLIYVYQGTALGSLTEVGLNDDAEGELQSQVNFDAIGGVEYRFVVHGVAGASGNVVLNVDAGIPALSNDDLASFLSVGSGVPLSVTGLTNVGATIESGEIEPLQRGGASAWFAWTSPATPGRFQIDTFGSALDTILYVFSQTQAPLEFENLELLALDDNSNGTLQSRAFIETSGVETFYFSVHGRQAKSGNFQVNVNSTTGNPATGSAPVNDSRFSPTDLGNGLTASVIDFDTSEASIEVDELDPLLLGGASVWYTWTPPMGAGGRFNVSTAGSDYGTLVYVYEEDPLFGDFLLVGLGTAAGLTPQGEVNFEAEEGFTYYIGVNGDFGRTGLLDLSLSGGAPAAPANDDFANALDLGGGVTGATNVGASIEISEPDPIAVSDASVWYKWTAPPGGGWFQVDTIGSSFNTFLLVGEIAAGDAVELPNLNFIDGNVNEHAGTTHSLLRFNAVGDQTYYMSVAGFLGITGSLNLNIAPSAAPPANDDFADATDLTGALPITQAQPDITLATLEVGEKDPLLDGGASVWYRWTAPSSGWFEADTLGSNFDTVLYAYDGTAEFARNLNLIDGNDDNGGDTGLSRLNFEAVAGQEYHFAVHGRFGVAGSATINLMAVADPPDNDDYSAAFDLGNAATATHSADNLGATIEGAEPDPLDEGSNSVWYCWTAPLGGGYFSIDTFGSDFDTLLYVFEQGLTAELEDLVTVAANDTGAGTDQSQVNFTVVPGRKYYIAVHGDSFAQGQTMLNIGPGVAAPGNDNFGSPQGVAGSFVTISGTNVAASLEVGEPSTLIVTDPVQMTVSIEVGGASVWYSWTAPSSGTFAVSTLGSNFDTLLFVFTGATLGTLVEVGANDDFLDSLGSQVLLNATVGVTYRFAVHGDSGDTGDIVLQVSNAGPYQTWIARYPSLTGNDALRDADSDDDGLRNIEELMYGTDPTQFSNIGSAVPGTENAVEFLVVGENLVLEYEFDEANLNGGVGLPIEITGGVTLDFVNFTEVTPTALGGGVYRVQTPFSETEPKKFLTILATEPNP